MGSGMRGTGISERTGRRKRLWALLLLLLAAGGFSAWLFLRPRPAPAPPLSPEEEVRQRFRRNFDPEETTLSRYYALREELRADKRISGDAGRQMAVEMLAESVSLSFSDFAKLPPEKKADRAKLLREDAWRTMIFFRLLPEKKKREALSRISSTPGGRAQIGRAVDVLTKELGPEDREMLGPAVKIWKDILEGKVR